MAVTLLLTDAFVRKTFDVYNALRQKRPELKFLLLHAEEQGKKRLRCLYPAAFTRRPPVKDWEELIEFVKSSPRETFIYLPFEEATTLAFYAARVGERCENIRACLPDEANFRTARNKLSLARFCQQNRLPAPKIFSLEMVLSPDFSFVPLIGKPAVGSGGLGHLHIDQPTDLHRLKTLTGECVIQQKLPNPRAVEGGFFLMQNGRLKAYYGHQRERTYPVDGGVTVYSHYRENPAIRTAGARILAALNWNGLAMLEFLYDEDDATYKLIEINPRLWGSVLLSEFSGADLVVKYLDLALEKPLVDRPVNTAAGIRWLIPYDLLHAMNGGWKKRSFWRVDRKNTCYVNMTYASVFRSFCWHLFSVLDPAKIGKLVRKMRGQ